MHTPNTSHLRVAFLRPSAPPVAFLDLGFSLGVKKDEINLSLILQKAFIFDKVLPSHKAQSKWPGGESQ